jgi:cytochrome c oxidase subunit 4
MSSTDSHAHDEHHDDGDVHAHESPAKLYIAVFLALIALTLITVGLASIHLGPANLAIAIIVASLKAILVCTFFMHLSHDNRFHAIIVIATTLFIGVFFAYTSNDTGHRTMLDPVAGARVLPASGEKAPGGWEPPTHEGEAKGEAPKGDAPKHGEPKNEEKK